MDIKNLKSYLKDSPDKIISILEKLDFHHIQKHEGSDDDYITCGHPDGDNKASVTIYLNDSLLVIDYTRDLCQSKVNCDFLDLICFFRKDYNFFDNLKYIAEESGLGYYHDFNGNVPKSLLILKTLKELINKVSVKDEDDEKEVVPRNEKILSYYYSYVNDMFFEDGISYGTQREFEIGLDPFSGYITIPVRDEIGNLVGIKGRFFNREVPENELKYYYIEKFPKGRVLYGYFRSKEYIKESDYILVGESEKSYLQMWTMNHRNCVATGGTKVSQHQIDKLSRLNKRLILCFDRDFTEDKIQNLRNKFLGQIDFWAMIDKEDILGEKESPSDKGKERFEYLLNNCVYKIDKTTE